ncbi:hypothetical protein ACHAXR_007689 [Thalassiosira sp. AJA248-18]
MAVEVPLPEHVIRSLVSAPDVAFYVPHTRDPSLPTTGQPLHTPHLARLQDLILHLIDHVFRPLTNDGSTFRCELVSLKKLHKGEQCSWDTSKLVLRWIIDTVSRVKCLWEILDIIPKSQRRTSMKKCWPLANCAPPLLSPSQEHATCLGASKMRSRSRSKPVLTSTQALDDFRWIAKDLTSHDGSGKVQNLNTTFWEHKGSTTANTPRHISSDCPASISGFIDTSRGLTTSLTFPTTWLTPSPTTFTYPCQTPSHSSPPFSHSNVVIRFGPLHRPSFHGRLRTAAKIVTQGVSSDRDAATIGQQWQIWLTFCDELLRGQSSNPRMGKLAAKENQIKSPSVENYLRAVAQTFLSIGTNNPRLNSALNTDFCIAHMLAA